MAVLLENSPERDVSLSLRLQCYSTLVSEQHKERGRGNKHGQDYDYAACSSRNKLCNLRKYPAKNNEANPLKSRSVNTALLEFKNGVKGKIEEHKAGDE